MNLAGIQCSLIWHRKLDTLWLLVAG